MTFPDHVSLTEEEEAAAALLGWHPDTSPETELSNEFWYRHESTLALKLADEVRDLLDG